MIKNLMIKHFLFKISYFLKKEELICHEFDSTEIS